ncbi:hypothetical protein JL722_14904 [Aureococcus anophagefferens]|nr:hypothetical protein JL722_14904 [Aureococcus anophagefferens]
MLDTASAFALSSMKRAAPVRDDARAPDSDDDDLGVPEPPAQRARRRGAAKTVLDALLGHDFGRRVSTGDGADLQAARDASRARSTTGPPSATTTARDAPGRRGGDGGARRRRHQGRPRALARRQGRDGRRRARDAQDGQGARHARGLGQRCVASPPADQAHLDAHVRDHVRAEAA